MFVSDYKLGFRFIRQPRALGTQCIYAPLNDLLKNPDIKVGEELIIVNHPENKVDLFVDVVANKHCPRIPCYKTIKDVMGEIATEHIKKVMWRDLIQDGRKG